MLANKISIYLQERKKGYRLQSSVLLASTPIGHVLISDHCIQLSSGWHAAAATNPGDRRPGESISLLP